MKSGTRTPATIAFFSLAFLAFARWYASAETFYVCQATGDDAHSGRAWDDAFLTLETAFSAAGTTPEQDTIRVAEGDYPLTAGEIPSGTHLFGGYPSGGGERDLSAFTSQINLSDCMLEGLRVNDDSTLDGFRVEGCSRGDDDRDRYGVLASGARITVRNCRIRGARGDPDDQVTATPHQGVGILIDVQSVDVVIQDNEIYDNWGSHGRWSNGGQGYGIKVYGTGIRIVGNNIHGNDGGIGGLPNDGYGMPSGDGHGIWAAADDIVISGNIVRENYGPVSPWADVDCASAGSSLGVSVTGRNIEISHNEIYSHHGGRGLEPIEVAEFELHEGGDGGRAFGIRIQDSQSVVVFDNLISGVYGGDGGAVWGSLAKGGDAGSAVGILAETSQCEMGNNTVAEVHPGTPGDSNDEPGQPAEGDGVVLTGVISPAVVVNNIAYMYEDCGFTGDLPSTEFTYNVAFADSGVPFNPASVDPSNTSTDPLFTTGPGRQYYLSQVAAGQATDSPCVDGGSDSADSVGLADRTTRTDDVPDQGTVDQGYHYRVQPQGNEPFLLRNDMITRLDPLTPQKNTVLPLSAPRDLFASPVTSPVILMNEIPVGSSPLVFYAVSPPSTLRAVKMGNDLAVSF